jgi:hypothetical protein
MSKMKLRWPTAIQERVALNTLQQRTISIVAPDLHGKSLAEVAADDIVRIAAGAESRLCRLQEALEHIQSPVMTPHYTRRDRICEKAKVAFAIKATRKLLEEIAILRGHRSTVRSSSS